MELKAIFFDFDGTLLNSEIFYQKFWIEASAFYGFKMEAKDHLNLRSLDRSLADQYLKERFGPTADYKLIHDKRVELMDEYLKTNRLELKEFAKETLQYINKELKIPCYIVSSSSKEYVESNCVNHDLMPYIKEIISVHGLKRGKPYPDVYLKALEIARLNKDEVVVVEDSPNGVRSAYAAGIKTIFIKDLSEADEEVKNKTIYQLDNIKELSQILRSDL